MYIHPLNVNVFDIYNSCKTTYMKKGRASIASIVRRLCSLNHEALLGLDIS